MVTTRRKGGQGSIIGIPTCCVLHAPRIESRWRQDFRAIQVAPRPPQPPVQWIPGSLLGANWVKCGADHTLPSRPEVVSG
jgi:hypothetical protein